MYIVFIEGSTLTIAVFIDSLLQFTHLYIVFIGITDQCNSDCSSVHSSSASSGEGSFLTEADFASAVARAAEMSGLTVVGTTVCDLNNKASKFSLIDLKLNYQDDFIDAIGLFDEN